MKAFRDENQEPLDNAHTPARYLGAARCQGLCLRFAIPPPECNYKPRFAIHCDCAAPSVYTLTSSSEGFKFDANLVRIAATAECRRMEGAGVQRRREDELLSRLRRTQ